MDDRQPCYEALRTPIPVWLRVRRLPGFALPKARAYSQLCAIDDQERAGADLQDPYGRYHRNTSVKETDCFLDIVRHFSPVPGSLLKLLPDR